MTLRSVIGLICAVLIFCGCIRPPVVEAPTEISITPLPQLGSAELIVEPPKPPPPTVPSGRLYVAHRCVMYFPDGDWHALVNDHGHVHITPLRETDAPDNAMEPYQDFIGLQRLDPTVQHIICVAK